ncbi:MAG: GTPase Era [Oscillospiraceae bacterium]|nr:GTPase Era [Oscillospiraceae bacterium]
MKNKSAMITIAGRPNVGKSTLTNALVGEKITIVSHKPQTTRNRICAVLNRAECQLVFVDTPGFHRPRTKLGDYMVNVVKQSVADVDAVILMVEPIANVGEQEKALIEQIKSNGSPCILVINKIDTVEKETLLAVIAAYQSEMEFTSIIPISAKWHDGLADLLTECEKFAQEGPQFFPEDMVTDQPEKQVMAEIIREKLLWNLEREIPHGTAVEITRFTERDDGIIDLDATIYCEKASHKGIIIGKGGEMLKKISTQARGDCERFMGTKVFLQTWVKVKENWRDSQYLIGNFGYSKSSLE